MLATTTPIDDDRHPTMRGSERYDTDGVAYNAALCAVAAASGVAVNDL